MRPCVRASVRAQGCVDQQQDSAGYACLIVGVPPIEGVFISHLLFLLSCNTLFYSEHHTQQHQTRHRGSCNSYIVKK